jgi:hypothetical protein
VAAAIAKQATTALNTLNLNMTFSSNVRNTRARAKYSGRAEEGCP